MRTRSIPATIENQGSRNMLSRGELAHEIPGPSGVLQAVLRQSASDEMNHLFIICHPHPQHGGTMQNKVVTTLARAAGDLGISSIRFNYRGVGASDGTYGEFSGECDDLRAVISWVKSEFPDRKLHLAGFSFGSGVASVVAGEIDALQ